MKALTSEYIDSLVDEEMLICCNCAYVDTKVAYISRCIGDKEVICPKCSSKAFLIFDEENSAILNERLVELHDDAVDEEVDEEGDRDVSI